MNLKEFEVLRCIAENGSITQRAIADETGYSLGTVNSTVSRLKKKAYLRDGNSITLEGRAALEPFRVDNAIILAAGMSTRFVPFSYEKPKGLTVVKGEVLIERQIRQLQEAGVKQIVLVLGHMMEKFLYLTDKYGVGVAINNEYRYKNTHSSLYAAREHMKATYVCCADNYFPKNVFHTYEYHSLYSTLYMEGTWRGERGVTADKNGLIVATCRPAVDQWVMNGYAYFNREFSEKFRPILEETYGKPETDSLYWEQIYAEHVAELPLYEKRYTDEDVLEFDSVVELEKFDPDYIKYNDLSMTRNICKVLSCAPTEISGIKPVEKGLTNKSFSFSCRGKKYIYRNPGSVSNEYIDRQNEKRALEIASRLGIDFSYIYADEKEGWKLSEFIDVTEEFDFSNERHLELLCRLQRKLYEDPITCGKSFDYLESAKEFLAKLELIDPESSQIAGGYLEDIEQIDSEIKSDGWPNQLVHNDVYEDNLLISDEKLCLIDWEYAGDSDIGFDLCKLFLKNKAIGEDIDKYLSFYYGRKPTLKEKKHIVGCAAVSFFYWYVWALYMVKKGNDYLSYMLSYLNSMRTYTNEYKKI